MQTAYEILKKFDEMYLKPSTALQIVCRNNLEALRLKSDSDPTPFFDDFERIYNELINAGASVKQPEKLNYLLKALP